MNLQQIRYFTAIVENGTMTAAAEALHVSQPPISAQITALEVELGCRLFDRTTRRIQLTDAGKIFYSRACGILNLCSSAQREMNDLSRGESGILHLGVSSSLSGRLFLDRLKTFCARRPGFRFDLCEENTYQLLERVRGHQLECALVRSPFSAPDLDCARIGSEPLCAVAAPDRADFAAGRGPVGLGALAGTPLLIYRRWQAVLDDAFRAEGLSPDYFCVSDDSRTVVRMAEAGFGAGIVPLSAVPDSGLTARPLRGGGLTSEICVVSSRDVYRPAAVRDFIRALCGGDLPHGA